MYSQVCSHNNFPRKSGALFVGVVQWCVLMVFALPFVRFSVYSQVCAVLGGKSCCV